MLQEQEALLKCYFIYPYRSYAVCYLVYLPTTPVAINRARLQAGAHQHSSREVSDGGAAVVMETSGGWGVGKWDQFVLLLKVTWQEEAPPASPRYHRFNRLELLLRSVTTKWLQRLRRRREPTERFMVGLIN